MIEPITPVYVEGIPRSTQWARANKALVAERDKAKGRTLKGKLTSLVINTKNRSKKKKWTDYELDTAFLMELWEKQNGKCALSGKEMLIRTSRSDDLFPYVVSVDRIDSSLGYRKANVQLVCVGANLLKNSMSMDQFLDFCVTITEVYRAKNDTY